MFTKTDTTFAPPATQRTGANTKSLLAADLHITGEITSAGQLEILGEVDGNVAAKSLVIGTEGRVSGSVSADVVEVKGVLNGTVKSQSFTLRSTSEVQADVSYSTLAIDSGAQIEGKFAHNS
jgi:cytoskeletal protein CcmA (bactofilin family)